MSFIGCWICGGRGDRQIVLRPGGSPDGRRICRVCTRRLMVWLNGLPEEELGAVIAELWPGARPSAPPAGEEWRDEVREAFTGRVREALPAEDDLGCAQVAVAYLDMHMPAEGVSTFARVRAEALESDVLSERLLTSILSRMLDTRGLSPEARERIHAALYPAA